MKTLVAALVALTLVGATTATFTPAEAAKKCKSGKVLDPETGKCVTPRGS